MSQFKKYIRTNVAEMRKVTDEEVAKGIVDCSISQVDIENGSPKLGDMIARNPKNHDDLWLVAEDYFKDNFQELIPPEDTFGIKEDLIALHRS